MSIDIPTAFNCQIRIPYGELKDVLAWCDRNCAGEFKYMEDYADQFKIGRAHV